MQSLWSRTGPLSSSCRCGSCLSTAANVITGRTSTAAGRRRLRIGNSVTMLYSTIFATAMMWDVDAKARRRNELEKKIGEAKEEVKAMQYEEVQLVENILSRRKKTSALQPQRRRHYSTAAALNTVDPPSIYRNETKADKIGRDDSPAASGSPRPGVVIRTVESDSNFDPFMSVDEASNWVSKDPLRARAILRLATKQMVIRFLLRPTIARSYSGTRLDYEPDAKLLKLDTKGLLYELGSIQKRINILKYSISKVSDPFLQDLSWSTSKILAEERRELDEKLFSILEQNPPPSSDMLLQICTNLLATEQPISPRTMSVLIYYFVYTHEYDLVSIMLKTMLPAKIRLTESVIKATLHFFNKTRDLYGFEGFMRRLQGIGGPVDIPKLWRTSRVGTVEIPVPPAPGHPTILSQLICTAIKFEQHEKANAWLHVMRRTGYGETNAVLGTYLRYYADKGDWETGAPFLSKAVTFIMSSKAHKDGIIDRLILYMLMFCHSCGKTQVSSAIISAAIESGFDCELAYKEKDSCPSFKEPLDAWRDATKSSPKRPPYYRTTAEKCHSFGTIIAQPIRVAVQETKPPATVNSESHSLKGEESFSTTTPKTPDPEQQQLRAEVLTLRKELDELRQSMKRNSFENQRKSLPTIRYPGEKSRSASINVLRNSSPTSYSSTKSKPRRTGSFITRVYASEKLRSHRQD
ncbi:hypothetical protein FQN54_006235 [Arachnomyces sp. PD_36]|nr:hypothetical protein FQN54_006235 [Arachnomyces sp. PD_36]